MIKEVIWTSAASQDYLEVEPSLVSVEEIDAILGLLRLFPKMGSSATVSGRVRRVLIGRNKIMGMFYTHDGLRLIILSLLDLRQNPLTIEGNLLSRGIGNR